MALVYENVEKVLDNVLDQASDLKKYAKDQMSVVTSAVNNALASAQVAFPELTLGALRSPPAANYHPCPLRL